MLFKFNPDLWPEGVEFPWIEISKVKNDRELRTIVVSGDRERLSKGSC